MRSERAGSAGQGRLGAGRGGLPSRLPPPKRRRPRGVVPEINVTPLVDVVLVLLIIFMVIAPQLEQGLRIDLPGIHHPDRKMKGALGPVVLTVALDGTMLLEKEPVTEETLEQALRELHEREPARRLVLEADRQITYGRARTLFRKAQGIGFPGIALMVGDKARQGTGEEED